MSLTPKKVAFIEAIRGGASNKDAAIAAGCSPKTASAAGSRMAKDPDVMLELHKLNALFPNGGGVKADVKAGVKAERSKRVLKPESKRLETPESGADVLDDLDMEAIDPSLQLQYDDPKDFLRAVMNSSLTDIKFRVDAGKALMPFEHQRRGEGGKKEQAQAKAAEVAQGRFGSRKPPQLKAVP